MKANSIPPPLPTNQQGGDRSKETGGINKGKEDGTKERSKEIIKDGHHAISLRTGREFPKTKSRPSDVSWRSEIAQEDAYKKVVQ
nr:hypothetical protein Iba_chr04bCG12690 [Ipomoea batatas]